MKKTPDNIPTQHLDFSDGRIFNDQLTYAEGEKKPLLRGVMHFLVFFSGIIIFACIELVKTAKTPTTKVVAFLLMFSLFACYAVSAFFHNCEYDNETEIYIQKLDHIIISLSKYFFVVAVSFVLPWAYQFTLLSLTTVLLLLNFYHISTTPIYLGYHLGIIIMPVLFLPVFYFFMNRFEWICSIILALLGFISGYIFYYKISLPFISPSIFGYHEVAHILWGITHVLAYYMIRSIFSRI